ncbi:MAG: glycosyltransferase [Cyanobacteria bacterium NC_groundwater_1444_Ag_S-0.65um_54_12]|nr:glycosyltransferase [Cyanobacteria bacterium NC_groundwater_1444_Ag_S-0.65um_54_12]
MSELAGSLKILLVTDLYYPPTLGGSAIAMRRLAHGLAARGNQVWVLAPGLKGLRHYIERDGETVVIRCRSLPDLRLTMRPSKSTVRVPLLPDGILERVLERYQPDIVHLQLPGYAGAIASRLARKRHIPAIATCHSIPENYWSPKDKGSTVFRAVQEGIWDVIVALLESCDVICAPSITACDLLHAQGLSKQAIPISNGVDLQVYHPVSSEEEKKALKQRFNFPSGVPTILYAGRFAADKRIDLLLDAIPQVLARTAAHFGFTGSGNIAIKEELMARGVRDHITITGLLDDQSMPLVYRAADLFVLPSEAELQGLVLLEAAASGLPLVGANALAIPEIIRHGENGYLHAPGDHEDLADRLIRLCEEPALRATMGRASLQLVQQHSIPYSVQQYEEIYREAITQAAGTQLSEC